MAGEAVVGALRVVLGMDVGALEDGIRGATKNLGAFAKDITTIATGISLEKVFEGIVSSIEHAIEAADKLGKASQKFGVPVETLSALSIAAEQSDVNLEELSSAMSRLSKNAIAAQGPTSAQASAFKALGISVKDASGQMKSADTLLLEIADSFSKFEDGTTKTALAVALFGRSGADLIPLLDQGASGIKKMTDRFHELGIVMSADTVNAAKEYNDKLKLVHAAIDAVVLRILGSGGMLEAMNKIADEMIDAAGDSQDFADAVGKGMGDSLLNAVDGIKNAVSALKDFNTALQPAADLLNFLNQKSQDAGKGLRELTTSARDQAENAAVSLVKAGMGMENLAKSVDTYVASLKKAQGTPPPYSPEQEKALQSFIDSQGKSIAALQAQVLTFGMASGAAAELKIMLEADQVALVNHIKLTQQQKDIIQDLAQDMGDLTNQMEGLQTIQANLTPLQLYNQEMQKLNDQLKNVDINQQAFAVGALKAGTAIRNSYIDVANTMVSNMANAFKDLASLNHQYAGIAKGFAIAQATTSALLAANNAYAQAALLGGPVLGAIAAATALAAGIANVAKISATQFATGGSFKVGGGRGFTDTQLVTMAMSPGEMVDVKKSGSQTGGQEIYIQGMGPDDLFTGKMLRSLFDALNQGQRDGYKLKVA